MDDLHLLLINPPQTHIPPPAGNTGVLYNPEGLIIKCMNPGILSIASYIHSKGYNVKILDMQGEDVFLTLERVLEHYRPWVVGISCTYGFAYLPSLECAKVARRLCPDSLVIMGGQHVGALGRIVLHECPELDIVAQREGEIPTHKLVQHYERWSRTRKYENIPGIVFRHKGEIYENRESSNLLVDLNKLPFFNFELWPKFRNYMPYIEESRGCPFRCKFCTSGFVNMGKLRIKKHNKFLEELKYTIDLYGNEITYPILASSFGLNIQNTLKILEGMKHFGIKWTTELRIDSPWEKYLKEMYFSGFRIASIGLESGSPEILLRMGKTKNPTFYMSRAQQLIDMAVRYADLSLKFNIIFYIGEKPSTIRQTMSFLLKNSDRISAVRFSPLFVFPGVPLFSEFKKYEKKFGASLIKEGYWEKIHTYPVNVSKYFGFEELGVLSNIFEKIFTNEAEYHKRYTHVYLSQRKASNVQWRKPISQMG